MIAFALMFLVLFCVLFAVLRIVFRIITSPTFAGLCNLLLILAVLTAIYLYFTL
jgi:hypothetical protein